MAVFESVFFNQSKDIKKELFDAFDVINESVNGKAQIWNALVDTCRSLIKNYNIDVK